LLNILEKEQLWPFGNVPSAATKRTGAASRANVRSATPLTASPRP